MIVQAQAQFRARTVRGTIQVAAIPDDSESVKAFKGEKASKS